MNNFDKLTFVAVVIRNCEGVTLCLKLTWVLFVRMFCFGVIFGAWEDVGVGRK